MALGSPRSTPTGRAERPAWRAAGVIALAVVAGTHVYIYFGASPLSLAISFLASAVGAAAGVVLLLARAPRLGWVIGGMTSALTFAAYCITAPSAFRWWTPVPTSVTGSSPSGWSLGSPRWVRCCSR